MTRMRRSLYQPTTTKATETGSLYRQRAQETDKPDKPEEKPDKDKKPQDKPQDSKSPQAPKAGSKSLTRELSNASIRALEGEGNERKFELSFSSEEPYNRGWCIEILDHAPGACDLTRLNDIGVLLFNHHRDDVLGRIERAWIDGARGYAIVAFDDDADAEVIYKKVKSGTLKGVSVGYRIEAIEEVMPNAVSADGRFKGPCDVARKWSPFEISIVSVPADPTVGVGRDYEESVTDQTTRKRAPSLKERQLQINHNKNF